jgi:aspartate kinase
LVVQKFGGTSVGSVARIHHVATLAMAARRAGKDVVVVVSAMSGETNRLLALADEVAEGVGRRERDTLAASGEQASAALTAIAIQAAGGQARAFLGHQIPIRTDANFGDARVESVGAEALRASIARGEIPVVAGFQGVDAEGHITTLGRGGSDTTAVAVAAALAAESCDIYTDVDGVYTADPNIVPSARKLASVPYEYMLTFAALGAKVLHDRCVELAMQHGVPVQVLTSFGDTPGTMIVPSSGKDSAGRIGGLACDRKLVHVYGGPRATRVGVTGLIDGLEHKGVALQDRFDDGQACQTFTLKTADAGPLRATLRSGEYPLVCTEEIARVSLVGSGLAQSTRLESKASSLLKGFGIKPLKKVVTDRAISYFLDVAQADQAMRVLHDGMAVGVGHEHGEPVRSRSRRSLKT